MSDYLTNHKLLLEIGIAYVAGVWTYARLSEGIENVDPQWNDVVQEYGFMSGHGYGESHVTGANPKVTVSGKRILGDAAQDYIAGIKHLFGKSRESSMRLSYVNSSSGNDVTPLLVVPCTIMNIVDVGGGESREDSVFSCEIAFKGAPTISDTAPLGALAVVSVDGSTAGKTKIYINPILTDGNSYVYQIGASVALPALGAVCTTGWAALTIGADITATDGNYIVVVEVDGDDKAVKGGIALITAA